MVTMLGKCFGVVGSGNRNFNNQYCLTAKQYSQRFGFPVLADFEMRGMLGDIKRVAAIIADCMSWKVKLKPIFQSLEERTYYIPLYSK